MQLLSIPGIAQTLGSKILIACRVCIIAGDISPIDVIIHIPVMCEDRDIPYIYVPSKEVSQIQHVLNEFVHGV